MMKINQFYIHEFKKFLDKINYSQLLYFVIGNETISTDPLPPYNYVKRNIQRCPSDIENIMAFLILGEDISEELIQNYLSKECLDYFCKINILVKLTSEYRLNNLVITSYANCYFFVSTPYYYKTCDSKVPSPYIGKDTFWLSRAVVNRVKGRVLDLCTGSGIQSILAAKTSESVCAVDIDSHAIQIATINSYLNEVNDKIEFICGDLYDALSQAEIIIYAGIR